MMEDGRTPNRSEARVTERAMKMAMAKRKSFGERETATLGGGTQEARADVGGMRGRPYICR
jgi:hypothetical protein